MTLSPEAISVISAVIVAVLLGVGYGVRRVTWGQVERAVKAVTPDPVEPLVLKAAKTAYEAVEQWAKKYNETDHQKRLDQALKYIMALVEFYKTNLPNPLALEALMESEVYQQNRAKRSASVPTTPEAVK
jgi:hypothetical protein